MEVSENDTAIAFVETQHEWSDSKTFQTIERGFSRS